MPNLLTLLLFKADITCQVLSVAYAPDRLILVIAHMLDQLVQQAAIGVFTRQSFRRILR